jgi:hypothetical protein
VTAWTSYLIFYHSLLLALSWVICLQ